MVAAPRYRDAFSEDIAMAANEAMGVVWRSSMILRRPADNSEGVQMIMFTQFGVRADDCVRLESTMGANASMFADHRAESNLYTGMYRCGRCNLCHGVLNFFLIRASRRRRLRFGSAG